MNYAIIGSGNVGSALARQFARSGIAVGIANTRGLPGILVGPFIPEGPAVGMTMDVDAAAAAAMSARAMVGDSNAWTNLSTFRGHGGKLDVYT